MAGILFMKKYTC